MEEIYIELEKLYKKCELKNNDGVILTEDEYHIMISAMKKDDVIFHEKYKNHMSDIDALKEKLDLEAYYESLGDRDKKEFLAYYLDEIFILDEKDETAPLPEFMINHKDEMNDVPDILSEFDDYEKSTAFNTMMLNKIDIYINGKITFKKEFIIMKYDEKLLYLLTDKTNRKYKL